MIHKQFKIAKLKPIQTTIPYYKSDKGCKGIDFIIELK